MAFLSDVWGKIKTTGGSTLTNLNGPEQSYVKAIPKPAQLGVGDDGNFGQMATNMRAGFKQVDQLIKGPALGNKQFVNTGGTCVNTQGKLVSRQNFINNKPDQDALGGAAGIFGDGLISGMITDLEGMIPTYLMKGMTAPATPACDLQQCPVSDVLVEPGTAASQQVPGDQDAKYLSAGMTPDLARSGCTKVPLASPADAQAATRERMSALLQEQTRLSEEISKNAENTALKVALDNVTEELETLREEVRSTRNRLKTREEAFTMMNSPATGGLLVAGILLAYLVFSKRR